MMESKNSSRHSVKTNVRVSSGDGKKCKQKKKRKHKKQRGETDKSDDHFKLSSTSVSPADDQEPEESDRASNVTDRHKDGLSAAGSTFEDLRQNLTRGQNFISNGLSPTTGPAPSEKRTSREKSHSPATKVTHSVRNKDKANTKAKLLETKVKPVVKSVTLSSPSLPKLQSSGSGGVDKNRQNAESPNESLRWEFAVEDPDKEKERIALYKMNRRKRYLAQAHTDRTVGVRKSTSHASVGSRTSYSLVATEDSGNSVESIMADVLPAVNAVIKTYPQLVIGC